MHVCVVKNREEKLLDGPSGFESVMHVRKARTCVSHRFDLTWLECVRVFVCKCARVCDCGACLSVCKGVVSTWCASLMCETSAMTVEPSVPKGETECKCVCARVCACACVSTPKHECVCVFICVSLCFL